MNDFLSLELDKVKLNICSYTSNDYVKEYIKNELIDFNPLIIKRKIEETKEFLDFLNSNNSIDFDGIKNPTLILNKALKESILNASEILVVLNFHNHIKRIKNEITKSNLTLIKDYTDSFSIDSNIESIIDKSIDQYGNIKSNASLELNNIDKELEENSSNISKYCSDFVKNNEEMLQEKNVCERNNRYVFLLKNSYKNKFNGYDYGQSGSGLASYIEPSSLVLLNNKNAELIDKRNEEINKILKRVTLAIKDIAKAYINNFEIMLNINVVYTKALYGYKNSGVLSSIGDHLFLKNIKHPLLDPKCVVANTYSLNSEAGIVISGSNTGGKTVSLKVIGLSLCLSYLGIPLFAEEAIIPIYDNILVDIDNSQSLKDSLSTFSSHIMSINNIINLATNKSLVLIDELISGTDPKYAEALSLSIIDCILKIGSKLIVTTHYDSVKKYAIDRKDILLSSVEFDEENLKPTYRYIENSIGSSNALNIASKYIDNKDIINKANEYIKKSKTEEERLLEELTKKIKENDDLKLKLTEENINLNSKIEFYNNKINELEKSIENKKKELLDSFNDRLNSLINDLDFKIKNVNNKSDINSIKKEIKGIDLELKNDVHFNIGDRVRVNNIEKPGIIFSINGDNCVVDINGFSVKTDIHSLTLLPKSTIKNNNYADIKHTSAKTEIVLVGKRVDESIILLEDFIDKARLSKLKKVKIIHGVGTLKLKDGIWEYLKKQNFIDKYYSADFYDGGLASTIVEFK